MEIVKDNLHKAIGGVTMRLPRKLKKGCRTLHGNPRTKWQRKGQLHIVRLFKNVGKTACAAAVGMDLLRQAVERINPVSLPSGGIVVPPSSRTEQMMVGESTGEIVLHRPELDRLKHVIMAAPISDVIKKINLKTKE